LEQFWVCWDSKPSSATASTSTTTGALIVAGGVGISEFIRTHYIFKRHKFSDNANKLCIVGEPGYTGTATMVNITTSGINTLNIRKSSLGIYAVTELQVVPIILYTQPIQLEVLPQED
jgi:hypothetical protein